MSYACLHVGTSHITINYKGRPHGYSGYCLFSSIIHKVLPSGLCYLNKQSDKLKQTSSTPNISSQYYKNLDYPI